MRLLIAACAVFLICAGGAAVRAGEREDAAWAAFKSACVADDRYFSSAKERFAQLGFSEPHQDAAISPELRAIGGVFDGRQTQSASRCFLYLPGADRSAMDALVMQQFGGARPPIELQAAADRYKAVVIVDEGKPLHGVLVGVVAPHDPAGAPGFVALTMAQ